MTKLLVTLQDGIKRITFNRPERRNAVDIETMERLHGAIHESLTDDSRVVILTGAGEAFCAGADLQARTPEQLENYDVTASLRSITNPTILAMRQMPKPIIARIHGPAAGIGCSYALACDIRIASERARLSQSFIRIGLMPDGGGTFLLPQRVGYAKAFELMATGDPLDAQTALALGLLARVVSESDLDAAVDALADRLVRAPAIALRNLKQALNLHEQSGLAAALEFEAVHQQECFRSEDFTEGVQAFLEKREAVFKGK